MVKAWRLYIDVDEPTELLNWNDVERFVSEDHPARGGLKALFIDTNDRVLLMPYRPFTPCRALLETMGQGFIDRVAASEKEVKVWSSTDDWVWLHIPGDTPL